MKKISQKSILVFACCIALLCTGFFGRSKVMAADASVEDSSSEAGLTAEIAAAEGIAADNASDEESPSADGITAQTASEDEITAESAAVEGITAESAYGDEITAQSAAAEGITAQSASENGDTAQSASEDGDTARSTSEEVEEPVKTGRSFLSNGLFSVSMPEDLKGTYEAWIYRRRITILDKKSIDGGFGGRVFTITAHDPSSKYNGILGEKKYGELVSGDGTVYDITLSFPTDVQFDYVTGERETYDKLWEAAKQVVETVASMDQGSYTPGAGMKGEDLYQDVLKKHVTAINEKWSTVRLEKEEMSPAYDLIMKQAEDGALDRIVYAYYDLTGEGVEELLIGELSGDGQTVSIYDVYGISEHKPFHALSGWKDNCYIANEYGLYNQFTGLNGEEYYIVHDIYSVMDGSYPTSVTSSIASFKIDRSANEIQPWFVYDSLGEAWKNVSEDEYNEIFSRYVKPAEINFKPLSKLANDN